MHAPAGYRPVKGPMYKRAFSARGGAPRPRGCWLAHARSPAGCRVCASAAGGSYDARRCVLAAQRTRRDWPAIGLPHVRPRRRARRCTARAGEPPGICSSVGTDPGRWPRRLRRRDVCGKPACAPAAASGGPSCRRRQLRGLPRAAGPRATGGAATGSSSSEMSMTSVASMAALPAAASSTLHPMGSASRSCAGTSVDPMGS